MLLLVPTGDPPSPRSASPMSRRRTPSLRLVGKTLDLGSVGAGLGARYRYNELEGEGAVASSIFCWLRRTGELKLCPSAAPSESDIRVPARALSAAKQGRVERPSVAGPPA